MKKALYLIVFLLSIILITGCKGKEKVIKCTMIDNQTKSGYKIENEYNIYSVNNIVNKVIIIQEITSDNEELLNKFKKDMEESYNNNNSRYGGYSISVDIKDNKIKSTGTIDYEKMNMKKYIIDNAAMKEFINEENKMTLAGAKKMYSNSGAKCE